MPRYEAAPNTVAASFEVFPKDTYEFIVGEPKPFYREGNRGPNWGVRYTLTVASEGPHKGKKYIQTLYEHSEAAKPINKQFLMAASGYRNDRASEIAYNKSIEGADWSFDTDSGSVGDAWRAIVGNRVAADLDVKLGPDDAEQQQVKAWRPL